MDGQQFDRVVRAMSGTATRRKALGGLLALATGAAGVVGVSAAKGGNGNGNGQGNGNGHKKVPICHKRGPNGYQFKLVPPPALKGHGKHGDTVCDLTTQCVSAFTGCNSDGTCISTPAAEGTACTIDGVAGACDAAGTCVPAPVS